MQNTKQHADFIRRLKQRSKQGARTILDDLNDAINGFNSAADTASQLVTTFTNNINELGDQIGRVFAETGTILTKVNEAIGEAENANSNYLAGLNKNLAVNRELLKIQTEAGKQTLFLEKRNAKLNKTYGIGVETAGKYSQVFAGQAKDLGISHKNAMNYAGSINNIVTSVNILGKARGKEYKNLVAIQNQLVTKMGLDAKAAEEFTYYATQQGKGATAQLKATEKAASMMDKALKTQNSFLVITEEIGKSSASTQLQFGRLPGSLELAAIKGKNLGLSLDQVAGIGNKMLNIESSIGDELEYQLLSGRRLIGNNQANVELQGKSLTNAFREAALMGDANKQADALNAILEQEGTTLTENVLARQQMAKLLGMEENQLARALQKKKLLEQMGADKKLFELGGKDFADAIEQMKAAGTATDEQIKQAMSLREQRTTEQLMEDQTNILEDSNIMTMLMTEQSAKIAGNSERQLQLLSTIAGETYVRGKTDLEALGALSMQAETFSQMSSLITNIKAAQLKEENAEDFLAINGKLVKYRKDDLVIGGTFGGRRQEVINQVTGNTSGGGGGGGMSPEQFAQAIVSAMQYAKFSVAVDDVAAMMRNA